MKKFVMMLMLAVLVWELMRRRSKDNLPWDLTSVMDSIRRMPR